MIREARPDDWPAIWPFFQQIVLAGETYAYDPAMTADQARSLWMVGSPDRTFVAVDDDGTVLGSAKSGPNPNRSSAW